MKVTTKQAALAGTPFIDALISAGLIPHDCARFAIDGVAGRPIVITYETYADERINAGAVLDGIVRIEKQPVKARVRAKGRSGK